MTALHLAAEVGNKETAAILLGNGADVNEGMALYGTGFQRKFYACRTPLHWAAANGYNALVELLIKHGAQVNALNSTFRTPLQEAIMLRRTDVVETLLKNGAMVNLKDVEG